MMLMTAVVPFLLILLLPSSFQIFQFSHPYQEILSCLRHFQPRLVMIFTCNDNRQDRAKIHKIIHSEYSEIRLVFPQTKLDAFLKVNTKNYEKFAYFLNMECRSAKEILNEASITGKFQFLFSWFLFFHDDNNILPREKISKIFKPLKNRMDMNVIAYLKNELYEIYHPGINAEIKIRKTGIMREDDDGKLIMVMEKNNYYESRKNLSEILIRSANVIRYPFKSSFHDYMVDPKLRKFDIYSKFHYQLFLTLKEIHGFSYNTTLSLSWFGNSSSGEDGGLAKLLWDDKIDISSAGCIIRLLDTDRIDFYDFVIPYYKFRSCFYFRNPGVVKPNFQEVLKPFAKESWLVTIYVTVIVCFCIEISYILQTRRISSTSSTRTRSIFIVIATFAQQSIDELPNHLSTRIIFFNLSICSLLLYNYYTSSLVSSLISTEPEVLKTIQELVESNLKVGIEYQPYTITYMTNRVKEDHYLDLLNRTKIYEKAIPNIFPIDEGIEKVHKGNFAFHAESINAYPLIADSFEQKFICDLAEIQLINSDTSLMAQKRSQYTKLFQISLRKMWQTGIMKKLHKTWVAGKPECLSSSRMISVTVNDLFLPYFLLAMGILCSIIILLFEHGFKRVKKKIDPKILKLAR